MNPKGCARKRLWHNLRYFSGICLEKLGQTTKKIYIYISKQISLPKLNSKQVKKYDVSNLLYTVGNVYTGLSFMT
jgi:hypothetical protein